MCVTAARLRRRCRAARNAARHRQGSPWVGIVWARCRPGCPTGDGVCWTAPPLRAPAYDALELLELGALELLRPLPICVQWCVPADPDVSRVAEPDPAELDPADGDADDDLDECDDVVDACVVDALAPPVDASATPVAPAPSPPAMTPVMMSRRTRPPVMETIRLLPSRRPSLSATSSSGNSLDGWPIREA